MLSTSKYRSLWWGFCIDVDWLWKDLGHLKCTCWQVAAEIVTSMPPALCCTKTCKTKARNGNAMSAPKPKPAPLGGLFESLILATTPWRLTVWKKTSIAKWTIKKNKSPWHWLGISKPFFPMSPSMMRPGNFAQFLFLSLTCSDNNKVSALAL